MLSCELAKEEIDMLSPLTQIRACQLHAQSRTGQQGCFQKHGAADISIHRSARGFKIQLRVPISHISRAE